MRSAELPVTVTGQQVTIQDAAEAHVVSIGPSGIAVSTTGDLTIQEANVAFTSGTLTHNGINVGDSHTPSGVEAASSTTGAPQ